MRKIDESLSDIYIDIEDVKFLNIDSTPEPVEYLWIAENSIALVETPAKDAHIIKKIATDGYFIVVEKNAEWVTILYDNNLTGYAPTEQVYPVQKTVKALVVNFTHLNNQYEENKKDLGLFSFRIWKDQVYSRIYEEERLIASTGEVYDIFDPWYSKRLDIHIRYAESGKLILKVTDDEDKKIAESLKRGSIISFIEKLPMTFNIDMQLGNEITFDKVNIIQPVHK